MGSLHLGSIGLGVGLNREVRSWSEPGLEGTSLDLGNVDMCCLKYGSSFSPLDIRSRGLTESAQKSEKLKVKPWSYVGDE